MQDHMIITLSRQYGSGGRELGEKTNYHMMLNAGKTGTKAAADVIMDYISKVQKPET